MCTNVNAVKSKADISSILQVDGNISVESDISDDDPNDSLDGSEYNTDEEAFPEITPANLLSIPGQNVTPGQPLNFDVNQNADMSSSLPLCLLLNARSVYNKSDNMRDMLHQVGPDVCIISEMFERERRRLSSVLDNKLYKSISYYRKNRAPGGGCAILHNEKRFSVLDLDIPSLDEIENVWALMTPKQAG